MPVSPGIFVSEFDFSDYAPALGLATLCVVGGATRGPLNTPTALTSVADLVRKFGEPVADDMALHAAVQYLKKGNRLLFVRVAKDAETADVPVPGISGTTAVAATGSITLSAQPADGNTIVISDGTTAVTFEFDSNATVGGGNISVTIGASVTITRNNLVTAINAHAFTVSATSESSQTLALVNDTAGSAGNVTITKVGADINVSGMTGGANAGAAVASTGEVSFTGSANPSDGEQVVLRTKVPTADLERDAVGAAGNVTITKTGANIVVAGMTGGTTTARATGSIKFLDSAQPADGNTITVSDGATVVVFEFDSNASVVESANLRQVIIGADSYATMTNLIAKINAHAFTVSATNGALPTIFEFDNNAVVTGGATGVLIGTTAAASLLNLMSAINASDIGLVATNSTVTVPKLTLTSEVSGRDGNALIIETGANISATGLAGGVDALPGVITTVLGISASSPGSWGNTLQVQVLATTTISAPVGNFDLIIYAPVDDSGFLAAVERFNNLSTDPASDRYVETALAEGISGDFGKSDYIVADVLAQTGSPSVGTYTLGTGSGIAGSDGITGLTASEYIGSVNGQSSTGLKAIRNPETVEFNILAIPGNSHREVINEMIAVCAARGDSIALIDTPFGLTRDQVIDWHNGISSGIADAPTVPLNSSFAAIYWPWVREYDPYSKKNLWMPPSGFVAGVYAFTDNVAGPWYAPAGHVRGLINGQAVEYSPELEDRNLLVGGSNRVNPIVNFQQTGLTVFGNRTTQRRPSALDSVHVRRMLLHVEKLCATAVKYLVFEPNDPITWRKFELLVNPILDAVRAARGLEKFKVICDASTNPPEQRARKTMKGKLFLKHIDAAEIIEMDFALLATGADFSENAV